VKPVLSTHEELKGKSEYKIRYVNETFAWKWNRQVAE